MRKYSTVRYILPPYNNIQDFNGKYEIFNYGVELRFTKRYTRLVPWQNIVLIDTTITGELHEEMETL